MIKELILKWIGHECRDYFAEAVEIPQMNKKTLMYMGICLDCKEESTWSRKERYCRNCQGIRRNKRLICRECPRSIRQPSDRLCLLCSM